MPSQNNELKSAAKALASILRCRRSQTGRENGQKRSIWLKLAPEGKNITKEQADEIARLQIDGLYTGVDFARHYPNGELLSRLVGFTGYDGKDWQALNTHTMKFTGTGDKIVCIQMQKDSASACGRWF